jgi:3'(2'), 5'-bisphosphate nucleotidase
MPYKNELTTALQAARSAGQAVMKEYRRFQAIPDAPARISTDADRKAQIIILEHLHAVFPADALCAEETAALLANVPQTGSRQWIVDPIDGSRGFARKNGEFSIMIAFLEETQIVLGVVLEPAKNRLTYGVRGKGCWRLDDQAAKPSACRVSQTRDLAGATLVQSHSRNPDLPSPQIQALRPARVVESYSAGIKLAMVARGDVDLYLNTYAASHDWDICAGHILVTEAGGRVTGLRGEELMYGLPGAWQRHGVLASNGQVHEAALAALSSTNNTNKHE